MTEARHWLVLPAAGSGSRMNASLPKQYLPLAGRRLIEHTLACFLDHTRIDGIVVVLAARDRWWPELPQSLRERVWTAEGGAERYQSVDNGLTRLADRARDDDWILVHDAARPCLRRADLDRLLDTLADDPVGGLLAVPARDTMKRDDGRGRVAETVDRTGLWHALTPQMFRFGLLRRALTAALDNGLAVTDEAAALEAAGRVPRLVEGHGDNLKVTRPEDLALAEFHLARQHRTHN